MSLRPDEIASDYYLTHFLRLLCTIRERDDDLLREEELAFIDGFASAPTDTQQLFVRLFSRKGPYFVEADLAYAEIGDIPCALADGRNRGWFDDASDAEVALGLLTIPRIKDLGKALNLTKLPARKIVLCEYLLAHIAPDLLLEAIRTRYPMVALANPVLKPLLLQLYFGNRHQDLSEFVMDVLGHVSYELYPLDKASRPFADREVLDQRLAVQGYSDVLSQAIDRDMPEAVLNCTDDMRHTPWRDEVKSSVQRCFLKAGQYWERAGQLEQALAIFMLCQRHPARERQARILHKMGETGAAYGILKHIAKHPWCPEEEDMLRKFMPKVAAACGEHMQKLKPKPVPRLRQMLPQLPGRRVEMAVVEHMPETLTGYFVENGLWRSLFGLLFWDIVFLPMPGAFFNPFQRGPSDIFSSEFYANRKAAIEARVEDIKAGSSRELVQRVYDQKQGRANWFVGWYEDLEEPLALALERIPPETLAAVMHRFARSPRAYGSGFPDLLVVGPGDTDWALWEVKGPGDSLRPTQREWIHVFAELGVDVREVVVTWEKEKGSKSRG